MNCERKGLTEPPQEEDPEWLGLDATHALQRKVPTPMGPLVSEAMLSGGRGGGP